MKKTFTLGLILIVSKIIVAQPVITSAYNPIYGDTYIFKIVDDTSTAQPGQAGAGVIWNLSAMHGQLTTRQYNWMQTALTNDAVAFGTYSNIAAEVVETNFSTRYEFYQNGPPFTGDFKKVGTHKDQNYTYYGTGFLMYDYPLSYGQSCTDTMEGLSGSAFVHGRCTTTYDGHGSLQLEPQSGGNFTNVGRVKVEENYVLDYGPLETHHAETYYWFDHTTINMTKQPIAVIYIHNWIDLNGDPQHEKYALMRQILFINQTQELFSSANVSISPNPVNDQFHISFTGVDTDVDIQICDLAGRALKNLHLDKTLVHNETSLSMNDLSNGIYLAKITSEKGTVVKKFVKE